MMLAEGYMTDWRFPAHRVCHTYAPAKKAQYGMRRFHALIVLGLLTGSLVMALPPRPSGRDAAFEQQVLNDLRGRSPRAADLFAQATAAQDRQDVPSAVRLYQEVLALAPGFDAAERRLGYSLVSAGRREEGLQLLRELARRNPTDLNMSALAAELISDETGYKPAPAELNEALDAARRALAVNKDHDPRYPLLLASLGFRSQNLPALREAAAPLKAYHPELMATHYILAVLAASDAHWIRAEREIHLAGRLGLAPASVEEFLNRGVRRQALYWKIVWGLAAAIGAWLCGLALLWLAGGILSQRTLAAMKKSDTNSLAPAAGIMLRRVYRFVIRLAGFYYYFSLPFVLISLVGAAAGLVYGSLLLGRIPVQLIVLVGVGTAMSLYHMVASLFAKVEPYSPGRVLKPEEAPGLWRVVREVAEIVRTRPVDDIRITPWSEVAVYENGSMHERIDDHARRTLIVGGAALNDLRADAFRAVLAHEYGHFSNRDTAGGEWALHIQTVMGRFAGGVVSSGSASVWNLAVWFLKLYIALFRRIVHGATRLQEMLADRVAARNYGLEAFQEGLRQVIRRDLEFRRVVELEVRAAAAHGRAPLNFYEAPSISAESEEGAFLEKEFDKIWKRPTSSEDTHPAPTERLQLLQGIRSTRGIEDESPAWSLFADPHALRAELSGEIERRVQRNASEHSRAPQPDEPPQAPEVPASERVFKGGVDVQPVPWGQFSDAISQLVTGGRATYRLSGMADGFVRERAGRRQEWSFDAIDAITFQKQPGAAGQCVSLKVQGKTIRFPFFLSARQDSGIQLFWEEVLNRLSDSARTRISANLPFKGRGWTWDMHGLHVAGRPLGLSFQEIASAARVGTHVSIWRAGEAEPYLQAPATSANAMVLLTLCRRQIRQLRPDSRLPLGLVLHTDQTSLQKALLVASPFGLAALGAAVWLLRLAPDQLENRIWFGTLATGAVAIACAAYAAVLRRVVFYEKGIVKKWGEKSFEIRYAEAEKLTYHVTDVYHNGMYTQTTAIMRLTAPGKKLKYSHKRRRDPDYLDQVQDLISAAIALRLRQQLEHQKEVPWVPGVSISVLEIRLRSKGDKGPGLFVPLNGDLRYKFEAGKLHVFGREGKGLQLPVGGENFFPGFKLIQNLLTEKSR